MAIETLERRFAAVGARLKVAKRPWRGEPRIDIRTDARGEYFDLRFAGDEPSVGLEVVDVHEHRAGAHVPCGTSRSSTDGHPAAGARTFRDRLAGRTPRSERGGRGSIPCPGFRGPDS